MDSSHERWLEQRLEEVKQQLAATPSSETRLAHLLEKTRGAQVQIKRSESELAFKQRELQQLQYRVASLEYTRDVLPEKEKAYGFEELARWRRIVVQRERHFTPVLSRADGAKSPFVGATFWFDLSHPIAPVNLAFDSMGGAPGSQPQASKGSR